MKEATVTWLIGLLAARNITRFGMVRLGWLGEAFAFVRAGFMMRYLVAEGGDQFQFLGEEEMLNSRQQGYKVGGREGISMASYVAGAFKGLAANTKVEKAEDWDESLLESILPIRNLLESSCERLYLGRVSLQSQEVGYGYIARRRLEREISYLVGVRTLQENLLQEVSAYQTVWLPGHLQAIESLVRMTGETPCLKGAGSSGILSSPLRGSMMRLFQGVSCHKKIDIQDDNCLERASGVTHY